MGELFARIYVDECLPHLFIKFLKDKNFDVISAYDIGNVGLNDAQQLAAAVNMKRVIMTTDKRNFLKNSNSDKTNHFGIIIITKQYKDSSSIYKMVNRIIKRYLNFYTADEFINTVFLI